MTAVRPVTITETFDHVLVDDPGRVALITPSRRLTYEELDAAADAAAAALADLGVGFGDRIAATLPNEADIVIAFHGAMRLGAIWVGINRNLAPPEKENLLAAAEPQVYLCDAATADDHREHWRVVVADPASPTSDWSAALDAAAGASRLAPLDPETPAGIAFTSGTTGAPKGIVHSQRNLLLPAAAIAASRGYDRTLRKGDCLALTILNLQVLTTLLTAAAGGCTTLTDRRDARGVVEWIERDSVTVWNGVPPILYSMVHDPEIHSEQLATLREVWTGGAPCPEDLFGVFEQRFGIPLRQAYGLTEAPSVVTIESADEPHVPGSNGRSLPHLELSIRDEAGHRLPVGETGEVTVEAVTDGEWAGAYRPFTGYWKDGSIQPFQGTRLDTGDIGSLDDAGRLYICDRKSLLILRGGANVYPAEVEHVIAAIEGVRGVAVFGIADRRLGEKVAAAIELDPASSLTHAEVSEHCRARLARYKVPEQIAIVDSLPRNAMGKVERKKLTGLFESNSTV